MRLYAKQPIGTVPRAQALRRAAPEPEKRLLRGLREAFPTHKWRHQTPVGGFFADILCFSEALVIEVDGDTHADTVEYDAARTAAIVREGFRVVRFGNADVMANLDSVLAAVAGELTVAKAEGSAAGAVLPSPFRRCAPPSLSQREREPAQPSDSSSSKLTATSALALSRTLSPSTSATSPSEMK